MVPTEEKPVVGAQKVMITESKSACREHHRIIMEDSKERQQGTKDPQESENNRKNGNSESIPINTYFK